MGLDPQAMRKLLHILEDLKNEGTTILMSTYALDTAEKICDRFVRFDNGQILQHCTLETLKEVVAQEKCSLLDALMQEKR